MTHCNWSASRCTKRWTERCIDLYVLASCGDRSCGLPYASQKAMNARIEAHPYLAYMQHQYARMLLARQQPVIVTRQPPCWRRH